jgi:hypothetical protein
MNGSGTGFDDLHPETQHGLVLFVDPRRDEGPCRPLGAIVTPPGGRRCFVRHHGRDAGTLLLFASWIDGLPIGARLGWSDAWRLELPREPGELISEYGVRPTVGLLRLWMDLPEVPPHPPSREIFWPGEVDAFELQWFSAVSYCMRGCEHEEHQNGCPERGCWCPNR